LQKGFLLTVTNFSWPKKICVNQYPPLFTQGRLHCPQLIKPHDRFILML